MQALMFGGSCWDRSLLGDQQFNVDFFLIGLDGFGAVLGVNWLHTLGSINWDFDVMHMRLYR